MQDGLRIMFVLNFSRSCSNQLQFCAPSPLLWCLQAPVPSCDALFMLAIALSPWFAQRLVFTNKLLLNVQSCSYTSICPRTALMSVTWPVIFAVAWDPFDMCESPSRCLSQLNLDDQAWRSSFCDQRMKKIRRQKVCMQQAKKESKQGSVYHFCFVLGFVERGFACP